MPEPVRFQFGPFDFDPATRQLRREGDPYEVPLGTTLSILDPDLVLTATKNLNPA